MYIRLKELRIKNNLTQKDISDFLEITEELYNLFETGKKSIPVSHLSKLAKYYKTSIDYIIGDTDSITPHN